MQKQAFVENKHGIVNKYYDFSTIMKKPVLTFPLFFELIIWLFYVGIYKYSAYMESSSLPHVPNNDLPYLQICLYSICSTLLLIPYYRWLVPHLLQRKKYLGLFVLTVAYFLLLMPLNNIGVSWLFKMTTRGLPVNGFFKFAYQYWDWNMMFTDLIAFFCIGLSRFSYQNEIKRHQSETDNLHLQLNMLKTQLQPHFLFNTLNSLYGLSLVGSKETPRFILLLSQMMQYILYDCDKEEVSLQEEIDFLKGYFELEQQKFPKASIVFQAPEVDEAIKIPPLLFLPLVENSFKHGRHKLEDHASVLAHITISPTQISFTIQNDKLQTILQLGTKPVGGIGLVNIKKRLELYYPKQHQLTLTEENGQYVASVILNRK
ncbi:sensor histidine kinase [Pedobacter sp. KR3-3]|uniref:Sensor histidine kinase n=1 Tax=Pedobacter albus TaxID=3113905 RepID=A0ABU7I603_9SPHI|nr:sensor histidine kinase [Pedobacter sp. KR3-3]MEE1944741.1 sensor histidine kinase [Pedobacter sp. KR3-3]